MSWTFRKEPSTDSDKKIVFTHPGWIVAIDKVDEKGEEQNQPILQSQLFLKEEDADEWYRKLDFDGSEVRTECIMLHVNEFGEILDSYII